MGSVIIIASGLNPIPVLCSARVAGLHSRGFGFAFLKKNIMLFFNCL
jgi:hypothetical protein